MGRHQPGSDLDLRLMAAVDNLLLRISPEQRIGKKSRSIWHSCALKGVLA